MPETETKAKAAQRRVLRTETVGLLVLAILIFAMILLRWGRFIDWHAR